MYQYNVCLIPEPDGRWSVEVPALPGCVTWGNTKEGALERIKEAVELYLEVLIEEGKPAHSFLSIGSNCGAVSPQLCNEAGD